MSNTLSQWSSWGKERLEIADIAMGHELKKKNIFQTTGDRRHRVSQFISLTDAGRVLDHVQVIMSLLSCICFVWDTYSMHLAWYFVLLEIFIALFFLLEFLLRLYISENRFRHVLSFGALLDILSVVGVFDILIRSAQQREGAGVLLVLRCFRVLRVLQTGRVFEAARPPGRPGLGSHSSANSIVYRHIGKLIFILLSLLFCISGFMYTVESLQHSSVSVGPDPCPGSEGVPQKRLTFDETFYWVLVTLTTVGYGDYIPTSVLSRLFMCAAILVGFVVIPSTAARLAIALRTSSLQSAYTSRKPHVVIIGDVTYAGLSEFLLEFFNIDHGARSRVVILSPKEPEEAVRTLLLDAFYQKWVIHIRGTGLENRHLYRARVNAARACFVMAHTISTEDPLQQDAASIMRAVAVKRFAPHVPAFVQLIRRESKPAVIAAGVDHCFSTDELLLGLLGLTCLVPGTTTFVHNLCHSFSKEPTTGDLTLEDWQKEYHHGRTHEIYRLVLPSDCVGSSFAHATKMLYSHFNIALIGIENMHGRIKLCPRDYIICRGDAAFCLAQNQASVMGVHLKSSRLDPRSPRRSVDLSLSEEGEALMQIEPQTPTPMSPAPDPLTTPARLLRRVSLTETTPIEDSSPEDLSSLKGHIIVFGRLQGLEFFLEPLRVASLPSKVAVVVLHPTPPSLQWRKLMSRFSDLYFFLGSASNVTHLRAVGLARASKIVAIASSSSIQSQTTSRISADMLPQLADSDTIMALMQIDAVCRVAQVPREQLEVLVELSNSDNIKFLAHKMTSDIDFALWPSFAAGHVCMTSMLDSLLCQSFFNPHALEILDLLICGRQSNDSPEAESVRLQVRRAGAPIGGATYGELFDHFVTHYHGTPVALYRACSDGTGRPPYVFTNPPAATVVQQDDCVLFIS